MIHHADLFAFNGRIHTLHPALPFAQAIAARDGRIVAIGSNAETRTLAGPETESIDLGGQTVLPGFIDAHVHLLWLGRSLDTINLEGARSLQECLARVQAYLAERRIAPGVWVRGSGWDEYCWAAPILPTRHDLDALTPHNPVLLMRKDGHSLLANSRALALAEIEAVTENPPGGVIDRDAAGQPTGIVRDNAMEIVLRAVSEPAAEEKERGLLLGQERALSYGVTSVGSMETPPVFFALQALAQAGKLKLRVSQSIPYEHLDDAIALGVRSGLGDEWLRVAGLKLFADGSLGSATALLLENYEGRPGERGVATRQKAELRDLVRQATAAGIAPIIHAIGDRANRDVLDIYEESRAAGEGEGLRYRIEHCQLVQPVDVARFGRLGVIASMQPTHCTSDRAMAEKLWGRRSRYAYAWRSMLDSGAILAFGSDAPVETISPLVGMWAAMTRRSPQAPAGDSWYAEQCLTADEALRAYTMGAAYALNEERHRGSLALGKLADMVVLSKDILAGQPEDVLQADVEMTIVGGSVAYRKG